MDMIVLGIESSCDETAAAVVEGGKRVLSSVVASQVKVHHPYGGVVPELASRKHIEVILPVVKKSLVSANITSSQINGIAVTRGPGLVGALLVGYAFAKAYAYALNCPLYGVNHLEGHLHSVLLCEKPPSFPFVALLVSGGHTNLYYVKTPTEYELMGQTRDDAVGEAYDKVSKMMGLGYPGGGIIDGLAEKGDHKKISFPIPYVNKKSFDFSFSGLKTAVNRYLKTTDNPVSKEDIAAAFQYSVIKVLSHKLIHAAKTKRCKNIALVGGVAANKGLRTHLQNEAKQKKLSLHIPSIDLCGDNAAMIAAAGYHHLLNKEQDDMKGDVFSRSPRL